MFLVSGFLGCEGKTKIEKPAIISNKIVGTTEQKLNTEFKTPQESEVPSTIASEKDNRDSDITVSEVSNSEIQTQNSEDLSNQNNSETNDKNLNEVDGQNTVLPQSNIQVSLDNVNNNVDEEKSKAAELLSTLHQEGIIIKGESESRLDYLNNPFLPLFSDEPLNAQSNQTKKIKKIRPEKELTPLEKVDLSQLKLVATLRAISGNKALVEDSTGKGYVINKGTYIGINSGSVIEITNESVVVEEEIETLTGDIKIQKREIKLQKAPGE